ncbi:MAG: hypothetical protein LBE21_10105 [Pseudomonadales bacterium]|jgi:hypothetical protein|nr:hypothetical protein [Pseudomonadales bacterium]
MIRLPATPDVALREVVVPALALLPVKMDTPEARLLLLAIGEQESGFAHRRQIKGPARGLFQFEVIAVTEVMTRTETAALALAVCVQRGLSRYSTPEQVHAQLEQDDVLACVFARLLVWLDPAPLPPLAYEEGAWRYYRRCWKPGADHVHRWSESYKHALGAMTRQ